MGIAELPLARRLGTIDMDVPAASRSPGPRLVARMLDVVVASLGLVLALPLLGFVAAAVKLDSRGPLLHRSWRAGHRSAPLGVVKFRKMHADAAGPPLTVGDDARFTRVGAVLARTHLDELPQLWNVLVGQMALVGPRPEDRRFTRLAPRAYDQILSVRPGLTGWTQLVWVDECAVLSSATDSVRLYVDHVLPRKVQIDLAYVGHRRLAGDLKILLWTPLVLLLGWGVTFDPARRELRLTRARPAPQLLPAPAVDITGELEIEEVVG